MGYGLKRKKSFTVVGIGQCSWDHLVLVDSYPQPDTKKEALRIDEQGGGPVATALVALSRLGVQCRFHGVTGDDREGRKIRQSLMDEGVDVTGLVERETATSQTAFIVIGRDGATRTVFWKRPSGDPLQPEELRKDFLEDADFLLLDGLMKDVSISAARMAAEAGIPVMLDAGRLREGMIELAGMCNFVVGSEEFARELGWNGNAEAFRQHIHHLGFGLTTITLGDRGSITFTDHGIIEIPSFEVEAVDTTGAGDVFHGGYIYGLLSGWDMKDTVTFASALAAMKCREMGGRAGIPGIEEVLRFLEDRGHRLAHAQ